MTAPSLRSLGAVSSGSTAAPSFAAPAGAVASDLIVIGMFTDVATTTVTGVPAGFSVAPGTPQTSNHELRVYYGRFGDVGAGPWGFTLSGAVFTEGRAAAIQDVIASGSPWDATAGASGGLVNTTVEPAVTVTSTGNDRYALYMGTNWSGGTWTPPTGMVTQWNANTKIISFADQTLATPQTITPQATYPVADKENAWVGLVLPAVSVPVVATPGSVVYGTKTNPQAGDIVVSSGLLIAGRYRIKTLTKSSGTLTSSDANNVQLLNGDGGTIGPLMLSSAALGVTDNPTVIAEFRSPGTVTVTARSNGSGTAATYGALLVTVPEVLYP